MPPPTASGTRPPERGTPPPRPIPPKAMLVREGADFWRVFNLNPLEREKPND